MKKLFKTITLLYLISISNNFSAQEDKVVELTTTGTGKTKDVAVHTALRSAIEQAFGVFISSKTEVLNDELLTDQIISVSNGNIQHYDIISEMPIDDNTNYVVTVKSKVSISKLTSFIDSKGIEVEFKGAVFAMNIKQQKLNEESELKAIKEMAAILKNIADRSFDFEVAADGEPTLCKTNLNTQSQNEKWDIPLTIKIKLNQNFENYKNYFQKTLSALTMTEAEAKNYIELKKPIYSVMLRNQIKIIDTLLINPKRNLEATVNNYLINPQNLLEIIGNKYKEPFYINKLRHSKLSEALKLNSKPEKTLGYLLQMFNDNDSIKIKVISDTPLYHVYYLRNENSSIELQKLVFYFAFAIQNFILDDGVNKIDFTNIFTSSKVYDHYVRKTEDEINGYNGDNWSDIFKITLFTDRNNNIYSSSFLSRDVFKSPLKNINPYNEKGFNDTYGGNILSPKLNNLYIKYISHTIDLNDLNKSKDFLYSGSLFHPSFPGLFTLQYNCNDIILNSSRNIVLQFNDLCSKDKIVAVINITDEKSIDELNKLKGYKIYPNK
jgi:hypothetical protein